MRFGIFVLISIFAGFLFFPVFAESNTKCVGSDIRVFSSDALLARQVCMIVSRVKPKLKRCHLSQVHPLDIVVGEGSAASGYLAHYSAKTDQIRLPSPEHLTDQLMNDSAFRAIAPADLFESIIVHELTHAFFAETTCGLETCRAGHEYLAFAMQLDSLPWRSRELLLKAHPAIGPIGLDWFDDTRLAETPDAFAVNAWRHFSQTENGCNLVAGLVSGEIVFPSEFE